MGKHTESNSDKMYKLLNIDSDETFDENAIMDLIKQDPTVCNERYPIDSISLELIYPLHAVCALNGSLALIKKVYKANPDIVQDNTTTTGTVLHYCCSYDVSNVDIVHYIAKQYPNAIEQLNLKGRTPLHCACHYEAKHEIVAYLTEKFPIACTICDEDGYTPLHVACDLKTSRLEIVEDLTEVCPEACIMQGNDQSTPLHLAIKNSVDIEVIKDLLRANKVAASMKDEMGRLPLHVAVDIARTEMDNDTYVAYTMDVLKAVTPRYPEGLEIQNNDGYTPQQLAEKYELHSDIVSYLNPYEE